MCYTCYDLKHTFRSKCLSNRVRASVSPPGHTAEGKPSVSKPGKNKLKEGNSLFAYAVGQQNSSTLILDYIL